MSESYLLTAILNGRKKFLKLMIGGEDTIWKQLNLKVGEKFGLKENSFYISDLNDVEIEEDVLDSINLNNKEIVIHHLSQGTMVSCPTNEVEDSLSNASTVPFAEGSDNDVEIATSNSDSQSVSQDVLHSEKKLIEELLLNDKVKGKAILDEYKRKNFLSDNSLRNAMKIVANAMRENYSSNGEIIPRQTKIMYGRGCSELFPTYKLDEKLLHLNGHFSYEYFFNPIKNNGVLETALKSSRKMFKNSISPKRCIFSEESDSRFDSPKVQAKRSRPDEFHCAEDEYDELISDLKNTPLSEKSQVYLLAKFRRTFSRRDLLRNENPLELPKHFPKLVESSLFIENEFLIMYGEKIANSLLLNWDNIKTAVIEMAKEKLSFRQHTDIKEFLINHNSSESTDSTNDAYNDDDRMVMLTLLHLVPALGGIGKARVSIGNAFHKLFVFEKIGSPIQIIISKEGSPKQPYILALGRTIKDIDDLYIIVDRKPIYVPNKSFVKSLDLLFKSFFVFSAEYDVGLHNFFLVIQMAIYNIGRNNTKSLTPRVLEIVNGLLKKVKNLD